MGRSVLRGLTVLVLVAAVAIMAAPAFAGDASGAGDLLSSTLANQAVGSCAVVEDLTTGHFFIGVKTAPQSNFTTQNFFSINIVGPLPVLPAGKFTGCTFITFVE